MIDWRSAFLGFVIAGGLFTTALVLCEEKERLRAMLAHLTRSKGKSSN